MMLPLFAFAAMGIVQAASAAPTIESASWLAGRWVGEGLGGTVEETWAPAAGGQMIGHFRMVKDGKASFYELMLLDAQPEGLRLRVKHFGADFTAWEDKGGWISFGPVVAEPNRLNFKGMTYERNGDDLTIVATFKQKDGSTANRPLKLRRAPL